LRIQLASRLDALAARTIGACARNAHRFAFALGEAHSIGERHRRRNGRRALLRRERRRQRSERAHYEVFENGLHKGGEGVRG